MLNLRDKLYEELQAKLAGHDPLAGERKEVGDEERRNLFLASLQQSANQMGSIGGKVVKDTALGTVAAGLAESNAAGLKERAEAMEGKDKVRQYLLSKMDQNDEVKRRQEERAAEREQRLAFHQDEMGQRASNAAAERAQRERLAGADNVARYELEQLKRTNPVDPVTGMPLVGAGKMPPKEQFDAATYGRRLEAAEKSFEDLASKGYNRADWKESAQNTLLPEAGLSENLKLSNQAERNFINATLRRESGAAISESEFKNAESQYFPRANDTPAVLAQKKQNRLQTLEGMRAGAGNAWGRVSPIELVEAPAPRGSEPGTAQAAPVVKPAAEMSDEELDAEIAKLRGGQ